MIKFRDFLSTNAMLIIAAIVAIVSLFLVPLDEKYLKYFDIRTLVSLFTMMLVIKALKNIYFFRIIARKIVEKTGNVRTAIFMLVFITFFSSMLIANDMALITFLPLTYIVLSSTNKENYMAFAFIMQNIAANLGGMLTPFGNPENIYLFSYFNIPAGEFLLIMLPCFLAAVVIIGLLCLFVKNDKFVFTNELLIPLNKSRSVVYVILFVFSLLIVFNIITPLIGLGIIVLAMLFLDKKAFAVDYPLLLTFVCFFIFTGNIARIPVVIDFFQNVLSKNIFFSSLLSCQIISNVPTALIFSPFISDYKQLLLAVNVGSIGTLVSSLASLITFKEFVSHYKNKKLIYIVLFSVMNFAIMGVLIVVALFVKIV